jgi:hypothetical protein
MSPLRALPALALVTALALAGCGSDSEAPSTGSDPDAVSDTPTASPSESASAVPQSARGDFCASISKAAIRTGIEGKSVYDESWEPGQDYDTVGGVHAQGAEWGCAWTAKDGTSVTAWLFAEPVTSADATKLAKKARAGCEQKKVRTPGADVGVTVQCISDDDTVTRTQALYGDAWLSCSLQTPGILTRLDRAADWCDAVRKAALV